VRKFLVDTIRKFCRDEEAKAPRHTRYFFLMLMLCGALVMVGCNRSPDAVSKSENKSVSPAVSNKPIAKIDACALVTKADAEQILGEPVKDPKGSGGRCTYEITDFGIGGRTAVLLVTIETDGQVAFEMHKKMSGIPHELANVASDDAAPEKNKESGERRDSQFRQLSDIGDKAYMRGAFRGQFLGMVTVSVLKGDVWIVMDIVGTPQKGSEEALKVVAKKVADNF